MFNFIRNIGRKLDTILTNIEKTSAEMVKLAHKHSIELAKPEKPLTNTVWDDIANNPSFNESIIFMSPEEKTSYLQSTDWIKLRNKRLEIANYKCEQCGSIDQLEAHHVTYARLGNELIHDIRILCRKCHQKIHNRLGYDRITEYPINEFDNTKQIISYQEKYNDFLF